MIASSRSLLFILTCGCSCNNAWGPGSYLDPGNDPRWIEVVTQSAEAWNEAVSCGPVLSIGGEGDHPVLLVSNPSFPPELSGQFDGDTIKVREGLSIWEKPVLVHELGHALGFNHVDKSEDKDSIMLPLVNAFPGLPSEKDRLRAELMLCSDDRISY